MIDTEKKSFVDVRSMFIELFIIFECLQTAVRLFLSRRQQENTWEQIFTDHIYIIFISGFEIQFRSNLLKASSSQIIFQIDL